MKKRKIGLRVKFTLLFILFAAVVMTTVSLVTYKNYEEAMMRKYADEAVSVARLAASFLDGEEMIRYGKTLTEDEEYKRLEALLDNIKEQTGVAYLYVMMPVSEDNMVYIFDAGTQEEKDSGKVVYLGWVGLYDDNFLSAKEAMATGEPSMKLEETNTELGNLASAYVPIKDDEGIPAAFVGVDFSMEEIHSFLNSSLEELLKIMAVTVLVCALLLLGLVYGQIISPIRLLKEKVEVMMEGELGVQVPVKRRDEIGEIMDAFNRMSAHIGNHIKEVTKLNQGYYKFVPSVIFRLLNKKSVTEIQLGDHNNVPLEILSMQVNGFEESARRMNPGELFAYVNRIYGISVPVILEHQGVIENYFNSGFRAIYTKPGKNALESAIDICQKLNEEKRRERQGTEFGKTEIAFGISRGTVILGIVGHDRRLASVAMSEQISVMEYLRSIAGKYRAQILITGTAAEAVPDFETRYRSRYLGLLHISAADSLERIYDVYDGDEDAVREMKEQTKELFEKGVNLFIRQQFYDARGCFVEILKISQMDYAAREYLYLCNQYQNREETSDIDIYFEDL